MAERTFRGRFRRQVRRGKKRVEKFSFEAGEQFDRNLLGRLERLLNVRRFVITWVLLLILMIGILLQQTQLLSAYYEHLAPVAGGVYTEGILGSFTNANPMYATGSVDSAVSRLVFSSLFTYNDQNQLVGDLATGYTTNSLGTIYTVHLKPNLVWQDGQPLTSADVLYTYQEIQDPDAQSPFLSSWQNISIAAPNPLTVTFTLPNPLSSFPYSLTNGIVPQHILGSLAAVDMRSALFNTENPIGAGPFEFKEVQVNGNTPADSEETIELTPSPTYWGGTPKLDEFVVKAYNNQQQMIHDFNNGQLNAAAGLTSVPSNLSTNATIDNFPLTAAVMAFFKTSQAPLNDAQVRSALVKAADPTTIIAGLSYATIPVVEPLLEGQLGYNPAYAQATNDIGGAEQQLTADGWIPGANGYRYKGGQELGFTLSAEDTPEYTEVATTLQQEWRAVGVNVQLSLEDSDDIESAVNYHSYDALLYGISIGVDPDVFVYWDSSQADPRSGSWLNLSEYKSSAADDALEQGRTRLDPALRAIKYKAFLTAWQADAPALGLYQPRFLYITNGPVYGLNVHTLNSGIDRYDNVQNWEIREAKIAD
jgi:peptide/nickel transport system substrate-binding protein